MAALPSEFNDLTANLTLNIADMNDIIDGGGDGDWIFGGGGIDFLRGGSGNDYVDGGVLNDEVEGGTGDDFVRGGANDDNLRGDDGIDVLYGEGGGLNDTVVSNNNVPTIYDLTLKIDATSPVVTNYTTRTELVRRDVILGGSGNDVLQGGAGEDWIFGQAGNDVLTGGFDQQAEDLLFGGESTSCSAAATGAATLWKWPTADWWASISSCPRTSR